MFRCKRFIVSVFFLLIILLVSNTSAQNFTVEKTSSGAVAYTVYPHVGDSDWLGWVAQEVTPVIVYLKSPYGVHIGAGLDTCGYGCHRNYRGYAKFDLTGLPPGFCVDSMVITGHSITTDPDPDHILEFNRFILDPATLSDEELFSEAGRYGGILAYADCEPCMRDTGYYSVTLNLLAIEDFNIASSQGWFALGFTNFGRPFGFKDHVGWWDNLSLTVYDLPAAPAPDKPVASTTTPCAAEQYGIDFSTPGATGLRLYENSILVEEVNFAYYISYFSHTSGTYNYTAQYQTACGWSVISNAETVTINETPNVLPPISSNNSPCTGQQYTISWDTVPGVTLYTLFENGNQVFQSPTTTSISFSRSTPGTYIYNVQVEHVCGINPTSSNLVVTVGEGPAAPGAPTASDSSPCPNDSFTVTWQSVAGALAYHLYENNQLIYGGGDTTQTFSYSSGSYGYEIDAFDECGTSARSPVTQVAIQSAPAASPAPTLSTTIPCANATYTVSWGVVSGATIYRLYENNSTAYLGPDTSVEFSYSSGSFSYHMAAGNDCGSWGGGSPTTQVSIQQSPAVPSTPTVSTPTPCPDVPYSIRWNNASGASFYRLYENDLLVYEGPDTLYQFSYAAGTYMYFVVSGNLCNEWSGQSGARTVAIQITPSPPAAPSPDITLPCNGQPFTLYWPSVEHAQGYYLYESDTLWQKMEDTSVQLSLADGLYAFSLTAYNSCELFSAPGGATLVSVGDIPPAPDTLFADRDTVNIKEGYIVSWNSVGEGIRYRLFENDIGIFSGKEVSLALSHDTAGDYLYDLQICNDCNCSARSSSLLVVVIDSTGCCIGMTGNINGDPGDNVDISDLTYIVSYIFQGGPPPSCWDEADLTLDGSTDISDLTYLVSYIFGGGPPPPPCP